MITVYRKLPGASYKVPVFDDTEIDYAPKIQPVGDPGFGFSAPDEEPMLLLSVIVGSIMVVNVLAFVFLTYLVFGGY